ncbi:MAG: uracil-DNA glycosylase [Alphaproteobacteria bacterium]|nr:uracil-DNA glycosylase [Alphaproteobacteria bacterium]
MEGLNDSLPHPADVLAWYLDAGVDEAIGEEPLNRYALAEAALAARQAAAQQVLDDTRAAPPTPHPASAPSQYRAPPTPVRPTDPGVGDAAIKSAVDLALGAKTLDELRAALETFDGCPLKKTAMNLVFGDGAPDARVVFVGEAPGADEDRQGVPFVGASGQLLDKMLASIGLDRSKVFISNTVFWRPPGNRTPNQGEIAVWLPFVERIVEIIDPVLLVTVGGPATHSLLTQPGSVSRLRGRWFTYETPRMSHPITATAIYHPAYLLRTPAQKRQAWLDMLGIKAKLAELGGR